MFGRVVLAFKAKKEMGRDQSRLDANLDASETALLADVDLHLEVRLHVVPWLHGVEAAEDGSHDDGLAGGV